MLLTISRIISIFFDVLYWAILIRCILSWLPISRNNPFSEIIIGITEPILGPVRRLFYNSPIGGGSIDFSPIIALVFIRLAERLILRFLIFLFAFL